MTFKSLSFLLNVLLENWKGTPPTTTTTEWIKQSKTRLSEGDHLLWTFGVRERRKEGQKHKNTCLKTKKRRITATIIIWEINQRGAWSSSLMLQLQDAQQWWLSLCFLPTGSQRCNPPALLLHVAVVTHFSKKRKEKKKTLSESEKEKELQTASHNELAMNGTHWEGVPLRAVGAVNINIPASSALSEQREYSKGNVPHGTATYDEAFSIEITQGSFPEWRVSEPCCWVKRADTVEMSDQHWRTGRALLTRLSWELCNTLSCFCLYPTSSCSAAFHCEQPDCWHYWKCSEKSGHGL